MSIEYRFLRTYGLAVAVVVTGALISLAVVALAQGPAPTEEEIASSGIVFPVPELGGCRDKAECKSYCDQPENMPVCIEFAERHGLMSKKDAEFARKFKDRLEEGGPGGCRSPRECEAYCTNVNNMEECLTFAEKNGIDDENIKEGKKVLAYVRAGGRMPGGCTSKESCEAYCGEPDNMEECFDFAEKSGVGPGSDEDLSPEQMRKVMTLMRSGETPGGCRSKQQCEAFCENPNNFEVCVAFAEKAGFMKPEEAAMARKTGGKGPGDCRGPRECEAYCNAPENQEGCFQFAKEHGLLREGDLERMKEGMIQMRAGLENAPPEVAACLKASLGENIINDIQAGNLTPGPAIGEKARACFERFGQRGAPKEIFEHAPPEVLACAKEKLGESFEKMKSGELMPTPEMADTFRVCFQEKQFKEGGFGGGPMMGPGGGEGGFGGPPPGDFLNRMPPGVVSCLKTKLGDALERIKQGITPPPPDFQEKVRACFEEFRPATGGGFVPPTVIDCVDPANPERGFIPCPPGGAGSGGGAGWGKSGSTGGSAPPTGTLSPIGGAGFDFSNLPPSIFECAQRAFGENVIERLRSGALPAAEFAAKVKSCFAEGGVTPPSGGVVAPPTTVECVSYDEQGRPTGFVPCPTPTKGTICPAMPTVNECPSGQARVEVFRSPECGVYYGCKPADGQICAQVITPARDPATGACKNFPTPCDVPSGWYKVDSCESATYRSGGQTTYPTAEDPATRCAKDGGSWDSTANYCKYPQTSTQTQTYPSTEDPATRCAKEGGTWDSAANFCKFPQPAGGNLLDIFEPLLFFLR